MSVCVVLSTSKVLHNTGTPPTSSSLSKGKEEKRKRGKRKKDKIFLFSSFPLKNDEDNLILLINEG